MKKSVYLGAAAAVAFLAAEATAAVDFGQVAATEITVSEIDGIVNNAVAFSAIQAVEVGPAGIIYIVQRDLNGEKHFIEYDLGTSTGEVKLTATQIGQQLQTELGGLFPGNLIFLESVARYDATSGHLIIGVSVDAFERGLVELDTATTPWTARLIALDAELADLTDHDVLPNGDIVVANGADGVVQVDRTTGDIEDRLSEADFIALGAFTELPPETIAVSPVDGSVYIFCHDDKQLFVSSDLATTTAPTTPALQLLTATEIPGLQPGVVDFHGLVIDADGNIIAIDEATESLIIYPASGAAPIEYDFNDLAGLIGGGPTDEFIPTLWSGLAARKINADQLEVILGSENEDYGVLRIVFGSTTSVSDWMLH